MLVPSGTCDEEVLGRESTRKGSCGECPSQYDPEGGGQESRGHREARCTDRKVEPPLGSVVGNATGGSDQMDGVHVGNFYGEVVNSNMIY